MSSNDPNEESPSKRRTIFAHRMMNPEEYARQQNRYMQQSYTPATSASGSPLFLTSTAASTSTNTGDSLGEMDGTTSVTNSAIASSATMDSALAGANVELVAEDASQQRVADSPLEDGNDVLPTDPPYLDDSAHDADQGAPPAEKEGEMAGITPRVRFSMPTPASRAGSEGLIPFAEQTSFAISTRPTPRFLELTHPNPTSITERVESFKPVPQSSLMDSNIATASTFEQRFRRCIVEDIRPCRAESPLFVGAAPVPPSMPTSIADPYSPIATSTPLSPDFPDLDALSRARRAGIVPANGERPVKYFCQRVYFDKSLGRTVLCEGINGWERYRKEKVKCLFCDCRFIHKMESDK